MKLTPILTAAAMLFCTALAPLAPAAPIAISAQAEELTEDVQTETVDGITYEFTNVDGMAYITKIAGFTGSIFVPDKLGGMPVGYIGDLATEEDLPYGATYTVVPEVRLPDTLIAIGDHAFRYHSIEKVTFPASLRYIGQMAFQKNKLTSVTLPDSIEYLGHAAFIDNPDLAKANLPASLTYCGWEIFKNCTALSEVSIPKDIKAMGQELFDQCPNLKTAYLPAHLEQAGEGLYAGCRGITKVVIEDGAEYIPPKFCPNNSLTQLSIPDSVTQIGERAFAGSAITEVTLPKKLEYIGDHAFEGCEKLTAIDIPDTVRYIGDAAFKDCYFLESVTGMKNTVYIGYEAFSSTAFEKTLPDTAVLGDGVLYRYLHKADSPAEVTLPAGIRYVSPYALTQGYYYDQIGKITFADGLLCLYDHALDTSYTPDKMEKLTTVVLPESVESIGERAFAACPLLENLNIPDSVTYIGRDALKDTAYYKNASGYLIVGDGILYDYCGSETVLTVPDGVKTLSSSAFNFNMKVTSLTLPGSLVYIDDYACTGMTKLEKLVIPDSVRYIGTYAFHNPASLTDLTLGNGVEYIMDFAFAPGQNSTYPLEGVVLPSSLRYIDRSFGVIETSMAYHYKPDYVYKIIDGFTVTAEWGSVGADYAEAYDLPLHLLTDKAAKPGDINQDGSVDGKDVRLLQDMLHGKASFNATQCSLADVNADAQIDIFDLSLLKQMAK